MKNLIINCGQLTEMATYVAMTTEAKLVDSEIGKFNCGETRVVLNDSMRGNHIFIFQSFSQEVNNDLMDLLVTISAAKSASSKEITVVVPYLCYSRQERKTRAREPITAKLVADLTTTAGADRVVTVDLHAAAIQGFYPVLDNLDAMSVFKVYIERRIIRDKSKTVIIAPDFGSAKRARKYKNKLEVDVVIIEKMRSGPGQNEVVELYGGSVKEKDCIIVDDLLDTGGTLIKAAESLKNLGATAVHAVITHPVLSKDAVSRIEGSCLDSIHVGNTINQSERLKDTKKFHIVDFSPFIAEVVRRIINDESVSTLFDV